MKTNQLLIGMLLLLGFTIQVAAQEMVKPSIMVIPSDVLMNKKNYLKQHMVNGTTQVSIDYKRMFTEDEEIKLAISKIGELFTDRGYDLHDLESGLKNISADRTIEFSIEGRNGEMLEKTLLDEVLESYETDIRLDLTYTVTKESGPFRSLTFNIQAIETYTNKQIAAASGTSENTSESNIARILEQAVLRHIPNLQSQINNYFSNVRTNGREIGLKILILNKSKYRFDDPVNDDLYLSDIIEEFIEKKAANGYYKIIKDTPYEFEFNPIRIKFVDDKGRKVSARSFLRDLDSHLRKNYNITSSRFTKGIGKGYLIIE
jgi:hypothetical protein